MGGSIELPLEIESGDGINIVPAGTSQVLTENGSPLFDENGNPSGEDENFENKGLPT